MDAADIHGPSEVIDPGAYLWGDGGWRGRPWEEAVVYELHVGAFTAEGTFRAAIERLDHPRPVREFFIHNALYWIEEFHFDGLRLDAVHTILDDGPKHLLEELAERVRDAAAG